jgi:hypothetical protein
VPGGGIIADNALLFYGDLTKLIEPKDFNNWCVLQQSKGWVVYAKRSFAEPEAVLAYLSRYTHPVAIANIQQLTVYLLCKQSAIG